MPAPTYPSSAALAEGTGTRSFAAQSTSNGDYLVIELVCENNDTNSFWSLSGGGLTYTTQNDTGQVGGGGHCRIGTFTAPSTGGSITVQVTPQDAGLNYHGFVTVVSGTGGPSGKATSGSAQTVSTTRNGANSGVFMTIGDWAAGAVGSPSWTPGGSTTSSQQGSFGTYIHGRWDDSGSAGTASHGISSPSYTTPTCAVLEMLGTADAAGGAGGRARRGPGHRRGPAKRFDLLRAYHTRHRDTTISAGTIFPVDVTDSVGLTDSAEFIQQLDRTDQIGLTDSTAFTEALERTDQTGLTDSATEELIKLVAVTDQTGLTDSLAFTEALDRTDQAGLTDASTTATTFDRIATDQVGLTDAATVGILRAIDQTDSVGLTDAAAFAAIWAREFADQLGLTDSVIFEGSAGSIIDAAGRTTVTQSITSTVFGSSAAGGTASATSTADGRAEVG